MTGQQSIKEWTDYPLSFFVKKRKTEWLGQFSLTWHNFVIFAYLNYIMNFLKVNVLVLIKDNKISMFYSSTVQKNIYAILLE